MPLALPTFLGGMPGGMELAVVFLLFLLFAVPVGLVIVGVAVLFGRGASRPGGEQLEEPVDERLDRVETQLDEIQAALDSEQNHESGSSDQ